MVAEPPVQVADAVHGLAQDRFRRVRVIDVLGLMASGGNQPCIEHCILQQDGAGCAGGVRASLPC
ncbi:hypothetical protein D3C86_2164540 [compost metagenome]